ncbi:hypothetical protein [Plesiocystis pacifica]|uniref:hypothetical protein n=1 Tax=Plesiocystis pacifica TaxID=191768 RepID=UPI0012FC49BA|nr:hypothetical protein [Plesiocystis pacifica]
MPISKVWRRRAWCLALVVIAGACGDGSQGGDCVAGTEACACVEGACATGLSCVSNYCVALGGPESDTYGGDSDDEASAGDSGGSDSGGAGEDLCAHFLDCVKQVQPEGLSAYALLYGPGGECYGIPGLTDEDCWAECDALREGFAQLHPNESACGPVDCGDGALSAGEMCDGGPNCTEACRWAWSSLNECGLATQVGCDPSEERCTVMSGQVSNYFGCQPHILPPDTSTGPNAPCLVTSECAYAPNAICIGRPDCIDQGCCTEVCYLGPTDLGGCSAGFTCTSVESLYSKDFPNGSELFGLCWPS